MKTGRCLVCIVAMALSAVSLGEPLRFMTFNIWGDYFKNPVAEREAGVEAAIVKAKPDLVSLQEVTYTWWASRMFANLADAGYVAIRGDEVDALRRAGAPEGKRLAKWVNHEPLLYRSDRLKLLDSGLDFFHFKLQVEKSVTWGVFEDRTDGSRFIAFATHFWWQSNGLESDTIRELNARHVLSRVDDMRRKWGDLPVIGGGDLNSRPGSLAHEVFRRAGWHNAAECADERSSFNSHHGNPERGEDGAYHGAVRPAEMNKPERSIDHVFYTDGFHALKHEIDVAQPTLDVSDHSPVIVDVIRVKPSSEKR